MMISIEALLDKLEEAPAGFGFTDIGQWLQDFSHIDFIKDIAPVFYKPLTRKQLQALLTLLKYRYIKQGPAQNLFDDYYQQFIQESGIEDFYKELSLYHDRSQILDFSMLNQLVKLIVGGSVSIEHIMFPENGPLEALELTNLTHLVRIDSIAQLEHLKYLVINNCECLESFEFIKSLPQLIWLDLSANSQLTALDFLTADSAIVMLQLLDTPLIDYSQLIEQLVQLKHLKYLAISAKQTQLQILREALPYCVINGMTAFNKTSPLMLN